MVADYPARPRSLGARFWLVALAALIGAGVTLRLGFWQLSRAEQKQAVQANIEQRFTLPPLGPAELAAAATRADPELLYRRVLLQGHWLADHTVFLDNRQVAGKPGFYVLTPLQLLPSGLTVVIQRGWVQRNFIDRNALPRLDTPKGDVWVQGRIAPAPAKLYEFGNAQEGKIRQNLDLARFQAELGLPLAAFTVMQSDPQGDGLVRDWPAIDFGVDKNLGYAFQWFAFSALITCLYIWFQVVRRFFFPAERSHP